MIPDEGIKVNWPSKSVLVYDKRPISIAQVRYDELDAANMSRFEPGSTFLDLFNDRLKDIPGKRQKIQITIDEDDVDHTIGNKTVLTPKIYGPFKISVSKLDNEDMYKFMIHTLLQNNFTTLSTQEIIIAQRGSLRKVGRDILISKQLFLELCGSRRNSFW